MPELKKFITAENLPELKEDFQTIINQCKADINWKRAYTNFALAWNRGPGKNLGYIPQHTQNNLGGVFMAYSNVVQENTREEIERIFGGIILKVGHKDISSEELGDSTSLLEERKTWKHTDEPEVPTPKNSKDNKPIDTLTEDLIYDQFKRKFLACEDIINSEKWLPGKNDIVIDTVRGEVKGVRAYINLLPDLVREQVLDFMLSFKYKS